MHTTPLMSCRGHECTLQKILPLAGPLTAFVAMLVVMAAVVVPAMVG